jgi:NADPH2:quinone reductase
MRAVLAKGPGPPEVLSVVDPPDPEPAPGQVVVAVDVVAVSFIDTQLRAGRGVRPLGTDAYPLILGNGVGGTVVAVGDRNDRTWLGVRVVTSTGGSGGYASRAVAGATDLHRVPAALDLAPAVAVLADGRTALGLVRAARPQPGETVAVTAAAGGVGGLAMQLAARAGKRVVALADDADELAHARQLGASSVVNYREDLWADQLDMRLHVVFDGVGGSVSSALVALLGPGGRYLPHGAASGGLEACALYVKER